MSDFVCYFGNNSVDERFDVIAEAAKLYLGSSNFILHRRDGCRLASMNGQYPLSVWNDEAGWITVFTIIF